MIWPTGTEWLKVFVSKSLLASPLKWKEKRMERNDWSFQEIMIIVCHYHWLLLHLLLLVLYFAHTMQHQNRGTFVPQISLYIFIYNPNGIKVNLDKFFQSYSRTFYKLLRIEFCLDFVFFNWGIFFQPIYRCNTM